MKFSELLSNPGYVAVNNDGLFYSGCRKRTYGEAWSATWRKDNPVIFSSEDKLYEALSELRVNYEDYSVYKIEINHAD